jgi:hypothetical protein
MLFAAVHESGYGTKRTIAALQQFVRYWTNNGQSSALARDASVATIEFFWKEKFIWALTRQVHQKFYNPTRFIRYSGAVLR